MRVTERVRKGDRGAVLIIVAVFAIVAVIFLAFVVDIGNQRQDRRQLTTATDAAALDVAQRWANNSLEPTGPDYSFTPISTDLYDCSDEAQTYLNQNRAVDAGDYRCEALFKNDQLGSVTVFAEGTTDYQVGSAVGIDEGEIGSTTSVRIASSVGGGLRPFALCASHPAIEDWYATKDGAVLGNPYTAYEGASSEEITVAADKFLPSECGSNNGNWGFIQFETQGSGVGSGGDDGKLASTIENGTDDRLRSHYVADGSHRDRCDYDYSDQWANFSAVTCVFDETGAGAWNNNNTMDAFEYLISEGITFNLPIYDKIKDLGGSKTGFPIVAFAEVRLTGYVQGGAKDNSITLEFVEISSGDCCNVTDANRVLEICDVGTAGGAVLATFDANCRTFSGSVVAPPSVPSSDPCVVVSVSPAAQVVEVDGSGDSVGEESVTITVDDPANCGTITLDVTCSATAISVTTTGPTASSYTATFAAGTTFAMPGVVCPVEVIEGGTVRDSSATMTTASAPEPCVVTAINVAPVPERTPGNGKSYDNLVAPIDVSAATTGDCSDLSFDLHRLKTNGDISRTMVQESYSGQVARYSNSGNEDDWDSASYRIEAIAGGATLRTLLFSI